MKRTDFMKNGIAGVLVAVFPLKAIKTVFLGVFDPAFLDRVFKTQGGIIAPSFYGGFLRKPGLFDVEIYAVSFDKGRNMHRLEVEGKTIGEGPPEPGKSPPANYWGDGLKVLLESTVWSKQWWRNQQQFSWETCNAAIWWLNNKRTGVRA